MDEIVKKFLLAGDKLMPEMHLMQPGLTWFKTISKIKEIAKKFKETEGSQYIYQNEVDKACF